jgi:hypothetical protein
MTNPRRERQFGYFVIEECQREDVAGIFTEALRRGRGQVHSGYLANFDQSYRIFLSNEDDFRGSWLMIAGRDDARWNISVDRWVGGEIVGDS